MGKHAEYKDYTSRETVKARRVDEDGETLGTSSHGVETVSDGYLVLHKDGGQDFMSTETFEARYELDAPKLKSEAS